MHSVKIEQKSELSKGKVIDLEHALSWLEVMETLSDVLLQDIPYWEIEKICSTSCLTLFLHSRQESSCCPLCGLCSDKKQSSYYRPVQGLPVAGRGCLIHLRVHRYYCGNPQCARKIFCERFPSHLSSYQRCLDKVNEHIVSVGLESGASKGSRLLNQSRIKVTRNSILRRIMALPLPRRDHVENIGIDDWARRKGHRYGTILIDNDTHQPLDLLESRDSHSVAKALKAYPRLKSISSDRADCFSTAIRKSCKGVKEIADRWHLWHNLSEVVFKVFRRYVKEISGKLSKCTICKKSRANTSVATPRSVSEQKFSRVKELQGQGYSRSEVARRSAVSRRTIDKYWQQTSYQGSQRKKYSGIEAYDGYLKKRFYQDHIHSSQTLHAELKQRGYGGCSKTVSLYIRSWHSTQQPGKRVAHWKSLYYLLKKEEQKCTPQQRLWRKVMNQYQPIVQLLAAQTQFNKALKTRDVKLLKQWLRQETTTEEVKRFIRGVKQDYRAVLNAFNEKWHNGVTEGVINKLKLIKRMCYGRASVHLLKRLLIFT